MIVQKMPLPKNPCTLPRSRWLHAGRQRKWPILRKERLLTRRRRWWLEAHHSDRVKGPKLGWENWIERFQNWRNFGPFLKGGNFGGFSRGRITVRMQEDKKTKRKFQMWIFKIRDCGIEQAIFSECGGWRKAVMGCVWLKKRKFFGSVMGMFGVSQDYSKHPPNSEMFFLFGGNARWVF